MRNNLRQHFLSMLIFAATSCTLASAFAQDADERARINQTTELQTTAARYQNEVKGIKAGYKEALSECRRMTRQERTSCNKEAKETFASDMAEAKRQFGK